MAGHKRTKDWVRYAWRAICFGALVVTGGCHSIRPMNPQANRAQPVEDRVWADPSELKAAAYTEPSANPLGARAALGPPEAPLDGPCADTDHLIDMPTALRLAGIDNPTINLAQEQIREARAGQLAARSLLIPSVNLGGSYRYHRGVYQDDPGFLRNPTSQSLYLGAGAGPIGSGTVAIPGVWLFAHLGDAYFEPLAARQRTTGRQSNALAVRNAVLLDVATAYFDLAGAEARFEILKRAEAEIGEMARLTKEFADAGQGVRADANRATANTELIRRQMREAEGAMAAASARLCRLLSLDPSIRLRAPGGPIDAFTLIDENIAAEELLDIALRSRPELLARAAAVQEARIQMRQQQVRPWVPLLVVGLSSGGFAGGSNQVPDSFSQLAGRTDLDVMAVWNVQNLGVGNHALVRRADSLVSQAVSAQQITVNQVRREVAEAQAAAQTAARQIDTAKTALAVAEEGFRLENERIKSGQGRPIEAIDSFRQLLDARQDLLRAILAYDISQFQLYVGLGSTPVLGK